MKHITMNGIKYTITECFAIKRNDKSYPFHTNALLINAELENGETVKHVVFDWKIPETNAEFSDMMNDINAWENFGEDHEIKEVEYAVIITMNGETTIYDNDHYDWYDTSEEAYNAAQDAIADPETAEEAIEAANDAIHLFEFSLEGFTHEPDFDDIALECEGVLR